jgi:hypothetical protein
MNVGAASGRAGWAAGGCVPVGGGGGQRMQRVARRCGRWRDDGWRLVPLGRAARIPQSSAGLAARPPDAGVGATQERGGTKRRGGAAAAVGYAQTIRAHVTREAHPRGFLLCAG